MPTGSPEEPRSGGESKSAEMAPEVPSAPASETSAADAAPERPTAEPANGQTPSASADLDEEDMEKEIAEGLEDDDDEDDDDDNNDDDNNDEGDEDDDKEEDAMETEPEKRLGDEAPPETSQDLEAPKAGDAGDAEEADDGEASEELATADEPEPSESRTPSSDAAEKEDSAGATQSVPSITTASGDAGAGVDAVPPPPTPVPTLALPCMKGVVSPDPVSGVHVCAGMWGMTKDAHGVPGHTSAFEYRHTPPATPAPVPSSGTYTGFFMLKQPPKAPLKIDERSVSLTFLRNSAGGHNLVGSGTNRFGKFTVSGVVDAAGNLEMFRIYAPAKGATPKPAKSPKRKKKAGGVRGRPVGLGSAAAASGADDDEGGQRMQRQNRGSWKDAGDDAPEATPKPRPKKAVAGRKANGAGAALSLDDEGSLQASRTGRQRKTPAHLKETPDEASERRARNADELRKAQSLMTALSKDPQSFWFANPVDPIALKIPDYLDIIKEPMDLGTIKKKLSEHRYEGLEDFGSDVRRTFQNAITYNTAEDNPVRKAAKAMSLAFEQKFRAAQAEVDAKRAQAEQKALAKGARGAKSGRGGGARRGRKPGSGTGAAALGPRRASTGSGYAAVKAEAKGEMRRPGKGKGPRASVGGTAAPASGLLGAAGDVQPGFTPSEFEALQRQMQALQNKIMRMERQQSHGDIPRQASGDDYGDASDAPEEYAEEVPVTLEEKKQLTKAISRLSADKMNKVVEIISERMPLGQNPGDEEIELDIEVLDTATIRELQNFVMRTGGKRKGTGGGAPPSKRNRSFDDDELFLGEFE